MRCHNCLKEDTTHMFCSIECAEERYSMIMEAEEALQNLLERTIEGLQTVNTSMERLLQVL